MFNFSPTKPLKNFTYMLFKKSSSPADSFSQLRGHNYTFLVTGCFLWMNALNIVKLYIIQMCVL